MQVYIEMDEGWQWWPTVEGLEYRKVQVDLPEATFSRYTKLKQEWDELQELFEHMYREQQGLRPYASSPYFKEEQNVKT